MYLPRITSALASRQDCRPSAQYSLAIGSGNVINIVVEIRACPCKGQGELTPIMEGIHLRIIGQGSRNSNG